MRPGRPIAELRPADHELGLLVDGIDTGPVLIAASWSRRLRGLFCNPAPALLIVPSNSVHSIGFGRPLEVAYVDKEGVVVAIKALPPWRMHAPVRHAKAALEAAPGWLAERRVGVGTRLEAVRR